MGPYYSIIKSKREVLQVQNILDKCSSLASKPISEHTYSHVTYSKSRNKQATSHPKKIGVPKLAFYSHLQSFWLRHQRWTLGSSSNIIAPSCNMMNILSKTKSYIIYIYCSILRSVVSPGLYASNSPNFGLSWKNKHFQDARHNHRCISGWAPWSSKLLLRRYVIY